VICRICDQDLEIPKDAILIDEARGLLTYRFINGEVHMFKRQKPKVSVSKLNEEQES
jgi:hypothetical protein